MNIANKIQTIRKEQDLTQEEFGNVFHVTRQTVSNWENEKSYPDLQTLVAISDRFGITLDTLIKEDPQMVKAIDKERIIGTMKQAKSRIGFFTGSGTGILLSCLFSPASTVRTVVMLVGIAMILIGWYKNAQYERKLLAYIDELA